MPISRVLTRLQDTTAQIRVRGSMLLLLILVVLAGRVRARDDPRCVHRGRDRQRPRPGRRAHASAVPAEARGNRLRLPDPGVLRHERLAVRPERTARRSRARCCGCRCSWSRCSSSGAFLHWSTGRSSERRGAVAAGLAAGDVAAVHRGGDGHRTRDRCGHPGDGRGVHRRRACSRRWCFRSSRSVSCARAEPADELMSTDDRAMRRLLHSRYETGHRGGSWLRRSASVAGVVFVSVSTGKFAGSRDGSGRLRPVRRARSRTSRCTRWEASSCCAAFCSSSG